MVDKYSLGMLTGALLAVGGLVAIASVSLVAGAGATAIVVGLVLLFGMYMLKMLSAFGF
ncbi:hypothetical protein [Halorientalis litorea]|jgi:hypothetical protein|uniref:hypothetical protein n=1 Tax=Halorientalis litorea TaxID=2931977 RepID=UPI001FF38360|nr:hypothetical protein [Halorientalis litorea]